MNSRKNNHRRGLWGILGMYILLLAMLLTERAGIQVNLGGRAAAHYLPAQLSRTAEKTMEGAKETCLVLYDSGREDSLSYLEQFRQILLDLRVGCRYMDVAAETPEDFSPYTTCVVLLPRLESLQGASIALSDWVYGGGRALLAMTLEPDQAFQVIQQKLGIISAGDDWVMMESFVPSESFMIGGGQAYTIVDAFESSLGVQLMPDVTVHATTGGVRPVPLVWSRDYGEGRFVVDNFGICERATRGFFAASYSLLEDFFAWPVFDGAVFYLDDFPSPVPGGDGTYVRRDYGTNIADFYTNYWWPDLLILAEKYGIRYTGVIIENYEDETREDPERQKDTARFQYFGNMLLHRGGEIGYHGYNHQPLCLDNFDYEGELPYNTWKSRALMKKAMEEVSSFGHESFPTAELSVYVPPSNVISEEGIDLLTDDFPEIRTIASTYFTGEKAYTQEFGVTKKGMVEQPRIVSGGMMGSYETMAALSELNMHFVFNHFMHPDDLLDEDRGAELGWEVLKKNLDEVFGWVFDCAPALRRLTGSELSASIQRSCRIRPEVQTEAGDDGLITKTLNLDGFLDEAELMVRVTEGRIINVNGGRVVPLTESLFLLTAESDTVVFTIQEEQNP